MSAEPILVVHGIANHDPEPFQQAVAALQARVGKRYRLIDVAWGDLGGSWDGLRDTLPDVLAHRPDTRGETVRNEGLAVGDDILDAQAFFAALQAGRQALMGAHATRASQQNVVDALYRETLRAAAVPAPTTFETRAGADDLYQTLSEAIPATRFLANVEDPVLQQAVGELLADYLQAQAGAQPLGRTTEGFVTRGLLDDSRQALKRFIGRLDDLVGKLVANVAGGAGNALRAVMSKPIALSFGDIVAYHQRRSEIHARLFARLDEMAPGFGTAEQPITVLAHSLGGLVTFDAALGSDVMVGDAPRRLHIRRWVTFGSQPAFFHVLAPRKGIAPYVQGNAVSLPPSIGAWTNLWHPMDMLAFTAAKVFVLSDGAAPQDVRIDTPMSGIVENRGWLHSVYWQSPGLLEALA